MIRFVKTQYTDPFESEPTMHYEVVELCKILNYTKRTSSASLEPMYTVYKFDVIGENVLEKSGLDIFQYLDLLKTKSEETKKKFNYLESPMLHGSATDEYRDIAITIGIKKEEYDKNKEAYDRLFMNYLVSPY